MKKKIILIPLLSVFLTGCLFPFVHREGSNSTVNNTTTETQKVTQSVSVGINEDFTSKYDSVLLEDIIDSRVELSSDDVADFKNKIDSVKVDYLYQEYFEIDKAMEQYENNKLNVISGDLGIIDSELEAETLYKIVKKNNENYLKKHSAIKKYSMPADSELRTICEWICESINYEIKNSSINIDAIEERVSVLKVFEVSDFTYGYYSFEDEVLAYNKKMIGASDRSTLFEEIICHETKHLVQIPSHKEVENTSIIDCVGVCYKYEGLDVNSLFPNWLFEGVAELQTLKQLGIDESLNYQEYVKSLEMLAMATITRNEVGELEKICMQTDLEELYKYFGATTKDEKREISTMLFAYNIIENAGFASSTEEFLDKYEEKNGEKLDFTERRYYGYNLSSSISQTMSKIFYKNLADTMENKDVSLIDVFSLIAGFELKLSEQSKYCDTIRAEELKEFYENYTLMQQDFFEMIGEKNNCSMDEIMTAYCLFYKTYKISEDISIISKENQEYLSKIVDVYSYYKQDTVVEVSAQKN